MPIHLFLIFALNNITNALEFMREEEVSLVANTVFLTEADVSKMTVLNKLHPLNFPKVKPKKKKAVPYGCSAEGHISHVFADRMSSRPLGWSRVGTDKMSRLRIYRQNKGDMLELVRYQKESLPKAAGAEETVLSSTQVMKVVGTLREKYGDLADIPVYTIPYPQIKKIAALKNHIWGL